MSKVLYVNGDSFPAGAELAIFNLPSFRGYLTKPGDPEYLAELNADLKKATPEELAKYNTLNRKFAWPTVLSKVTGIPLVDKSEGGNAMTKMAMTTIYDLEQLIREGKKPIALLAELSPDRHCYWFGKDPVNFYPEGYIPDLKNKDVEFYFEFIRRTRTDENAIREYAFHKTAIVNYCKVNGVPLYWIDSIWLKHRDSFPADPLWLELTYTEVLSSMTSLIDPGEAVYCPGGHLSKEVHQRLVQDIIKKLDFSQLGN